MRQLEKTFYFAFTMTASTLNKIPKQYKPGEYLIAIQMSISPIFKKGIFALFLPTYSGFVIFWCKIIIKYWFN